MHAQSLPLCLTLCDPMDCSLPGSSVHGDSPGKITGVSSLSLLQGIFLTQELNRRSPAIAGGFLTSWATLRKTYVGSHCLREACPVLPTALCVSDEDLSSHVSYCGCLLAKSCPCDPTDYSPTRFLCPWDFPGNNTRVCCHVFLQGIFPTQGSKPRLQIADEFFTTETPGKPLMRVSVNLLEAGLVCVIMVFHHTDNSSTTQIIPTLML